MNLMSMDPLMGAVTGGGSGAPGMSSPLPMPGGAGGGFCGGGAPSFGGGSSASPIPPTTPVGSPADANNSLQPGNPMGGGFCG